MIFNSVKEYEEYLKKQEEANKPKPKVVPKKEVKEKK